MKKTTNIIIFILLILFFVSVFFFWDLFLNSKEIKNYNEEKHIEKSLFSGEEKKENTNYIEVAKKIIIAKSREKPKEWWETTKIINQKWQINFKYIPENFKNSQIQNEKEIGSIIKNDIFYNFLEQIDIVFFEEMIDVRWKMKNKQVQIFSPQKMEKDEIIAIFIHEFAHYIDIYSLKRWKETDVSNGFYNISWNSTKEIKAGLSQKDFVSGYSMTNKYEDFAESLTYYILHNKDFLEKSINSDILRKKYIYFNLLLFKSEIFKNTDFSEWNKVKNYYWDITKINFSRKNFLQYLKNQYNSAN